MIITAIFFPYFSMKTCCWYSLGASNEYSQFMSEKTYLLTCAPNKDTNLPTHPCSLISFHCPHEEILHPWLSQNVPSEDSDQTVNASTDLNLCWAHISEGMLSDVTAHALQWWKTRTFYRVNPKYWNTLTPYHTSPKIWKSLFFYLLMCLT